MGEQRLRVLRQSLKRCCTRSSWLAGTDIVLIGCPPSTVEWTADDTNSISKIHAALPKGHGKAAAGFRPRQLHNAHSMLRALAARWLGMQDGAVLAGIQMSPLPFRLMIVKWTEDSAFGTSPLPVVLVG